jgi:hypothetical protein
VLDASPLLNSLLREFDKVSAQALKKCAQPIAAGTDVAYEAGQRIGVVNGIALAREAMINLHAKDSKLNDDL